MTISFSYCRDVVQAHSIDCKAFSPHWAKNTEASISLLKYSKVWLIVILMDTPSKVKNCGYRIIRQHKMVELLTREDELL